MKKFTIIWLLLLLTVSVGTVFANDCGDWVSVNDVCTFGAYEQDNNTDNGQEPIEWQVLAIEDDQMLLLSKYGLEIQSNYNYSWSNSWLRDWLNNDFIKQAFNINDINYIITVVLPNPDVPSIENADVHETKDKIFLLSQNDFTKYFVTESSYECQITPYAMNNADAYNDISGWWLRSAIDNGDDNVSQPFVNPVAKAVRPALWLKLTVDSGLSAEEMYQKGIALSESREDCDEIDAFSYFLQAAELGYPAAQYEIAHCYSHGKGTKWDNAEALKWYRKAADAGNADAQNALGTRYLSGIHSLGTDYVKAATLFRKAAEQGNLSAQYNLARCYEDGYGVEQDYNEALIWFQKAAEQNEDYREDVERVQNLLNTPNPNPIQDPAVLEVGDYFLFGAYEQDGDFSNGNEPIEWLVLAKEEDRVLLISKYELFRKNLNEGMHKEKLSEQNHWFTWENCTLRTWLNADFFGSAFTESEKGQIQTATILTDKEIFTHDNIFILSPVEAKMYFESDEARKSKTVKAIPPVSINYDNTFSNRWDWILRPGLSFYNDFYAVVDKSGSVTMKIRDSYTVRPALWLEL